MSYVVIIGCGVVGASIAYELSLVPGLNITVVDKELPAQGVTSAALGVLMGAIGHKVRGRAWQLRQNSMQRYETLIPELESITGRKIPFNRQGILMLCWQGEHLDSWQELVAVRLSQGWHLEIWDVDKIQANCPQISLEKINAAVYSPQDRQVDPSALTLALVDAADRNGVTFKFGVNVLGIEATRRNTENQVCSYIQTSIGAIDCDFLVIAAGLGATPLTALLLESIDLRPVLGQALHLRLENCLGNANFQPVITGNDVHIVPVGGRDYWVGATVEFPVNGNYEIEASAERLEAVMQEAIGFCPELAKANIIKTWSGLRPRPEGRPAPIIGNLTGYDNILLAIGHYRNGVLLAPATAQAIREEILQRKR